MNQTKLRSFAIWARTHMLNGVKARAAMVGITAKGIVEPERQEADALFFKTPVFGKGVQAQRQRLIQEIKDRSRIEKGKTDHAKGFESVVDEVAYTWFNRLAALRFMEVNEFLPTGVRVLSSSNPDRTDPDLLTRAETVGPQIKLPEEDIHQLRDDKNDIELYRRLLIAQCNALNEPLPFLFEEVSNYTELLLPDDLLMPQGIVRRLVEDIAPDDWREIEIVGWLYQFYIKEKKDAVIGKTVKKEDIPAATQLFTPRWIVEYMVQNSLGRLWLEMYPSSPLRAKMKYYVENPDDKGLSRERMEPEEIRCLDDACGSGHILVVMFDLLYDMYLERGYEPRTIPSLILRHNLVGIDIDRRACQLAAFALEMKAREKDRRFFDREVRPGVIEIVESNDLDPEGALNIKRKELETFARKTSEQSDLFDEPGPRQAEIFETEPGPPEWAEALGELIALFHDAKNYGSLLTVPDGLAAQLPRLRAAATAWANSGDLQGERIGRQVLPLIEQAEALAAKYHAVVANPPYIGGKGQNAKLKDFLKKEFKDYKSDVFSAFIVRNLQLTAKNGNLGFMTPFVWMFISSYEDLRNKLIKDSVITTLVQLEYSGFDGATVPICTFCLKKARDPNYKGGYIRLSDFKGAQNQGPKTLEAIEWNNKALTSPSPLTTIHFHRASAADFAKIPGSPVAYWVSEALRRCFLELKTIGEVAFPKIGMRTGDNERFLRFWWEICFSSLLTNCMSAEEFDRREGTWAPFNKGGDFRKWYGNIQQIVLWKGNGHSIKSATLLKYPQLSWDNLGWKITNESHYFAEGLTWTAVSSSCLGVRSMPPGCIFGTGGSCAFPPESSLHDVLGVLVSRCAVVLLDAINPTLNINVEDIAAIPLPERPQPSPSDSVAHAISLARADWDNFETSWDFADLPLLREGLKGETLEASWNNWDRHLRENRARMQELETENNRLWIEAYGLQDELTPEVPEDEITLARPGERERDMKAFVSYAVGCMMGRYALDKPGLILADAGDGTDEWEAKVGKLVSEAAFPPDEDGVIPVLDASYFSDDLTERLIAFVRTTFGPERLNENLDYLASALVKRKARETSRDALRRYLATKFYADHVKTYKKRPIYWLFTSGKERAFQALVYLHRYRPDTLAKMRTEYLHVVQQHLEAEEGHLEQESGDARKLAKVRAKLSELREFDQRLKHYADRALALDLDDGVKVNYAKFYDEGKEIVESIKGITDKLKGGDEK